MFQLLLLLLPLSPLGFGTTVRATTTTPFPANQTSSSGTNGSNTTTTNVTAAWSTRMIASIIARQQGLVSSSGQSTSTLESGLISLGIQAWLDLYSPSSTSASAALAPAADDATASAFAGYVDEILGGISATAAFTNVTAAALLPLDRLTVAQAIAGLEGEPVVAAAGDENGDGVVGGGRQLTAEETLALSALNESLVVQERNQFGGFWYVLVVAFVDPYPHRLSHLTIAHHHHTPPPQQHNFRNPISLHISQ